MNATTIKWIEQGTIAVLAGTLGYLAAHGGDIDPGYGPALAALAAAALNLLNQLAGKQDKEGGNQTIVAQALNDKP